MDSLYILKSVWAVFQGWDNTAHKLALWNIYNLWIKHLVVECTSCPVPQRSAERISERTATQETPHTVRGIHIATPYLIMHNMLVLRFCHERVNIKDGELSGTSKSKEVWCAWFCCFYVVLQTKWFSGPPTVHGVFGIVWHVLEKDNFFDKNSFWHTSRKKGPFPVTKRIWNTSGKRKPSTPPQKVSTLGKKKRPCGTRAFW